MQVRTLSPLATIAEDGCNDMSRAQGPSKLAVLLNQEHGPGRITGLGEVQYALARRLQLGVRYEDGGATGTIPQGIFDPSDRTLSVYAGLHNQPLPAFVFKHMLLHLHALWHAEQVQAPWPGHRAACASRSTPSGSRAPRALPGSARLWPAGPPHQ